MARIRVWVETNKVGSRCEEEFELDDREIADHPNEEERHKFITEEAEYSLPNMMEWGWEIIE